MVISAEWREYLLALKNYLNFHQISMDDFYQALVDYNETDPTETESVQDPEDHTDLDPEDPTDIESTEYPEGPEDPEDPEGPEAEVRDILPALTTINTQICLDLSEYPLALNAQIVYQIWLYFRQNDSMAQHYLGLESEPEIGYFQVNPSVIEAYMPIYNQHFESIFRAFLDRTSHKKRLFFVFIQDQNTQHLVLDWNHSIVKVYQVESNIGIDIMTNYQINHVLYTIFSSE